MKEPLRIQVEQTIYTWGEGFQKDHLVVSYKLINMSEDTLHDCSIGFVTDFDIGIYNSLYAGLNDSIRLYKEDMSLNLASCWSGFNLDEDGKDFGYLGLSLLRGPAIGKGHYLRRDKAIYQPEELAGLRSFKIWAVTLEPKTSDERYQYLTDTTFEEKYKGSDKRALISTELFNMIPGDTAKTAFLISFAMPSVREEADSTPENMAGLIEGVKKMRKYYYEDVIYTGAGVEESRTADHDDFKIYPNPSSGAVNIDLFIIKPGIYRAEVYDIYGRMVLAKSFDTAVSSSKNIKIDAAGLANGTYMVRITGPDGSSVSKKLIISG